MLVVLSPDSVESKNVRDEVSFALGHRKTIFPLLRRACTVPLRLHTLEYVDFTGEYASALSRLLLTLGVEGRTDIVGSGLGQDSEVERALTAARGLAEEYLGPIALGMAETIAELGRKSEK